MHSIAFDLGFIKIYWYSIFILLGVLSGVLIILKEAKKKKLDEDFIVNTLFFGILFAILGARLYYVIFNYNYYLNNPSEIFAIWNGGLAIHGGIILGLITVIFMSKKHKVNLIDLLDTLVIGLIIGQAIGRWGNFFNMEAYGSVVGLANLKAIGIPQFIINGMYIDGAYHHPTFLYESMWCLIGFVLLLINKKEMKEGQSLGFYLTWYGIGRFLIESLRTDSLMFGSFKIAQIISLIFIIVGIYFLFVYRKTGGKNE